MPPSPANLESPEVIRRLRANLVRFGERAAAALEDIFADVNTVGGWLDREVAPFWRKQVRRRREDFERAKREFASAEHASRNSGKRSTVDEKKAMNRARQRMEEAEEKLRRVKRWIQNLDRETGKRLQPCRSLSNQLDSSIPKALVRLDRMLDSLDTYFHRNPGGKA